ncbi:hypothetical protein D3C80_2044010 [compost metagenome]
MRQHRLDVGLVGQAVSKTHHDCGAFFGERKEPHFIATRWYRQRHAGQHRQARVDLPVRAKHL